MLVMRKKAECLSIIWFNNRLYSILYVQQYWHLAYIHNNLDGSIIAIYRSIKHCRASSKRPSRGITTGSIGQQKAGDYGHFVVIIKFISGEGVFLALPMSRSVMVI